MTRREHTQQAWRGYVYSLLLLGSLVGAGYYLRASITLSNHIMLYLLVVVYSAIQWGRGPSIVTAIASTALADWFFVPPVFEFLHTEPKYVFTLISLLAVGLVISTLTSRLREQTGAARERESEMASLYAFSQDLAETTHPRQVLEVCARHIARATEGRVGIFLPDRGAVGPAYLSPGWKHSEALLRQVEKLFEEGGGPDSLTDASLDVGTRLVVLRTAAGIIGVLGLQRAVPAGQLTSSQERLVETLARQSALAIERSQLEERERQARLLEEKYKLQKALLDSISHDLRTPLASITGAISALYEDSRILDDRTRHELVATARHEAERLNRLVANLLDMTRLEAGALHVTQQPCDLQDVVGAALARVESSSSRRPITVRLAPALPLVSLDFLLVTQVLVNLLDNALKYSPVGSPIEVTGDVTQQHLQVRVCDRGRGIPPEDRDRVFQKFYRVRWPDNPQGSGLGLSICRGLIEAHGGRIWAEPRPGGGTVISFELPLPSTAVAQSAGFNG
jgi:two-component system sensor histidine kinase KdpD